jgi:hypothetical protein
MCYLGDESILLPTSRYGHTPSKLGWATTTLIFEIETFWDNPSSPILRRSRRACPEFPVNYAVLVGNIP